MTGLVHPVLVFPVSLEESVTALTDPQALKSQPQDFPLFINLPSFQDDFIVLFNFAFNQCFAGLNGVMQIFCTILLATFIARRSH